MKTPLMILALAFVLTSATAQNWRPITSPIYGGWLSEYSVDKNGVLYGIQGLYAVRSIDKGLTWKEISPKKDLTIEEVGQFYGIAVLQDPLSGEVVVIFPKDGKSTVIYASYTGGDSWLTTAVPTQFSGAQLAVFGLRNGHGLAFASSNGLVYAISSMDGGRTWINESEMNNLPQAVHESASGVVYVLDGSTIRWRAMDGAWSTIPSPTADVSGGTMCSAGNRLFLAALEKVYITTDEGNNWNETSYDIGNASPGSQSLVGFADGSAAMFAVVDNTFTLSYRIMSNSTTWTTVAANIPWSIRSAIGFGNGNIVINRPAGMNFSSTWGATWELRVEGIKLQPIYRFAVNGSTIVATSLAGDIYRGTVDGTSWSYQGHPMSYDTWQFPIREVVAAAPSVYVASTATGIMRSTDDGFTWKFVNTRASADMCMRTDGTIASLEQTRIAISSDLGLTWQPLAEFDKSMQARSISEGSSGILYVAAKGGLHIVDADSLRLVHPIESPIALLAVASRASFFSYGIVGVNLASSTVEFSITTDGGSTWVTKSMPLLGLVSSEFFGLFDAVITREGHLYFSSYFTGIIHMTPSGVIASEGKTLQEFALALQLDPLQHLMKSGISKIEKSEEPVSVQEIEVSTGLFVSPLPATDVVQLRGVADGMYDVQIVNVLGSVVCQQSVTPSNNIVTLNVRTLAPGRYSAIIGSTGVRASILIVR